MRPRMKAVSRRVASVQTIRRSPRRTAATMAAAWLSRLNPAATKTLVSRTTGGKLAPVGSVCGEVDMTIGVLGEHPRCAMRMRSGCEGSAQKDKSLPRPPRQRLVYSNLASLYRLGERASQVG